MSDPVIIWPPDNIAQTTEERLEDLIRVAGIAWHREHDPDWRDNPWKDGIIVDLDESDVVKFIARYIIEHAAAEPHQEGSTHDA